MRSATKRSRVNHTRGGSRSTRSPFEDNDYRAAAMECIIATQTRKDGNRGETLPAVTFGRLTPTSGQRLELRASDETHGEAARRSASVTLSSSQRAARDRSRRGVGTRSHRRTRRERRDRDLESYRLAWVTGVSKRCSSNALTLVRMSQHQADEDHERRKGRFQNWDTNWTGSGQKKILSAYLPVTYGEAGARRRRDGCCILALISRQAEPNSANAAPQLAFRATTTVFVKATPSSIHSTGSGVAP